MAKTCLRLRQKASQGRALFWRILLSTMSQLPVLDLQPPTHFNPFSYDKCIASPGFCSWCLGDLSMDAALWMIRRAPRLACTRRRADLRPRLRARGYPLLRCPHPRPQCEEETLDSVQKLVLHLQDVHCWMCITSCPGKSRKSSRSATQDEQGKATRRRKSMARRITTTTSMMMTRS